MAETGSRVRDRGDAQRVHAPHSQAAQVDHSRLRVCTEQRQSGGTAQLRLERKKGRIARAIVAPSKGLFSSVSTLSARYTPFPSSETPGF